MPQNRRKTTKLPKGRFDEQTHNMELRIITDRPMYEIVGGEGACYKTSPVPTWACRSARSRSPARAAR